MAGRSAQLTDFDRPDRRGAVETVVAPAPGAAPAAEKTAMAIEVIDTMATRNASTWLIVPQRDACVIADPDGGERMIYLRQPFIGAGGLGVAGPCAACGE